MKVLLVNSTFGGVSGSGRHVEQLVRVLKGRVEFELWNVNTIGYLNFPKLRSVSFYLNCVRKRVPEEVDVVHIHNPKFAGLFTDGLANVLTVHGDYRVEFRLEYGLVSKAIAWYVNVCSRKANVVTTVSPYWAKVNGWVWIPNMINIRKVNEIEPANDQRILFVGRDDPIKNYPLFRHIAEKAYSKFGVKSLALGVRRGNLAYINHNVVEWRKVISYMKSALALIITSKQEGFPTTILEAWASKCPVIANPIPPLKSIAKINPGTLLLYNNVSNALAYIGKLMDKDFREETVEKEAEAVKQYDTSTVAEKYYKLYRILTKKNGKQM